MFDQAGDLGGLGGLVQQPTDTAGHGGQHVAGQLSDHERVSGEHLADGAGQLIPQRRTRTLVQHQ
ncbi:MAG: hypothetical protein BGO91_00955 [Leifsonia sp. 71-9]|nr:MAG: hypothetical protein BGO91_00955 [Leifsonia sp. 71-9]